MGQGAYVHQTASQFNRGGTTRNLGRAIEQVCSGDWEIGASGDRLGSGVVRVQAQTRDGRYCHAEQP